MATWRSPARNPTTQQPNKPTTQGRGGHLQALGRAGAGGNLRHTGHVSSIHSLVALVLVGACGAGVNSGWSTLSNGSLTPSLRRRYVQRLVDAGVTTEKQMNKELLGRSTVRCRSGRWCRNTVAAARPCTQPAAQAHISSCLGPAAYNTALLRTILGAERRPRYATNAMPHSTP